MSKANFIEEVADMVWKFSYYALLLPPEKLAQCQYKFCHSNDNFVEKGWLM